jgi:hypothetical protein
MMCPCLVAYGGEEMKFHAYWKLEVDKSDLSVSWYNRYIALKTAPECALDRRVDPPVEGLQSQSSPSIFTVQVLPLVLTPYSLVLQ